MSPDMADPGPEARSGGQSSLDPEITAALAELASRLEQQGVTSKVYAHDGMMSAMAHRDGDTAATVGEALAEASVVEAIAAEIATERGLPAEWLSQLGDDRRQGPHSATHDDPRTLAARLGSLCRTMRSRRTAASREHPQEALRARRHQDLPSRRQPAETVSRLASGETVATL